MIAVDDLHLLDEGSAGALAYAARRATDQPITWLLAKRAGTPSIVDEAFAAGDLDRVDLAAPNLADLGRILLDQLGLRLSRHQLRGFYDLTRGNPLFAVEVGRMVAASGRSPGETGEDLPVPARVDELFGRRVAQLDPSVRRVLLALALEADLRVGLLASIVGPKPLDDAVAAGIVVVDGDRVRPAHPLLAASAKQQASPGQRRELNAALATVVTDEQGRALHLARATVGTDDKLAASVSAAARRASARGGVHRAVELARHARRLTPPISPARGERVLELAGYLRRASEKEQITDLLEAELESFPPGALRSRAYLRLADGVVRGNDDIWQLLESALAEAGDDPGLRAPVLARMAENEAAVRVGRIAQAEAWAQEALQVTPSPEPEVELTGLYGLAWARGLAGRPIDDICVRHAEVSEEARYVATSPERIAAQRLVWRGEVEQARGVLARLQQEADARGEPSSYALVRLHICELEIRVGDWVAAGRLLDDWAATADDELLVWPMYERCRALVHAGTGASDEARRWAGEALARADATGVRWDWLEAQRALGLADLLDGQPQAAADRLRTVWEHTVRSGVGDPGAFPVAPDLVEGLAWIGAHEEAREVTSRLIELGDELDHPWARAGGLRCAGVIALAEEGYDEQAAALLDDAAAEYSRLGLRFDRARTLLSLGIAQRRAKKWGLGRDTLAEAVGAFDELGSSGWARVAREELDRVGARRPAAAGQLTPMERKVADLAVQGLSNKEIARSLVVTVNTVEFHLRNTYAKLGIRSRAHIAGRLDVDHETAPEPP